jgi:hypothetical protein
VRAGRYSRKLAGEQFSIFFFSKRVHPALRFSRTPRRWLFTVRGVVLGCSGAFASTSSSAWDFRQQGVPRTELDRRRRFSPEHTISPAARRRPAGQIPTFPTRPHSAQSSGRTCLWELRPNASGDAASGLRSSGSRSRAASGLLRHV